VTILVNFHVLYRFGERQATSSGINNSSGRSLQLIGWMQLMKRLQSFRIAAAQYYEVYTVVVPQRQSLALYLIASLRKREQDEKDTGDYALLLRVGTKSRPAKITEDLHLN
jgi:hypothetical protein